MSRKAYEEGRISGASQDGNREFISLLACIRVSGESIPPALIYKGTSGDLQDSWVKDLKINDPVQAYFASSPNGWSSNGFGLFWLEFIFHRYTSPLAGNRRRLLIVDGHSSHVNLEFVLLADRLRILLLILPPDSTHRLQPLDLSLFQPLATAYSKQLNTLTFESLGRVSMSKQHFYTMFSAA